MSFKTWILVATLFAVAFASPAFAKPNGYGSFSVGCLTEDTALQTALGLEEGEAAAMVTISPAFLWPPNHKFRSETVMMSLVGDLESPVDVSLTINDIAHDQVAGEEAGGRGCGPRTATLGADWTPTDFSSLTAAGSLQNATDSLSLPNFGLRGERCARDGTRTYSVSVTCCDVTNDVCDSAPVVLNVVVPKSKGKGKGL